MTTTTTTAVAKLDNILDVSQSLFCKLGPLGNGGPFALDAKYRADANKNKVNLIIGAYRDEDGNPWALSSVTEAKRTLRVESSFHEYPPLGGNLEFLKAAKELMFGPLGSLTDAHIASIQTISGTGANSLIAKFLHKHVKPSHIWLPDPTWINHNDIWEEMAPGVTVREYPYYDATCRSLAFESMIAHLDSHAVAGDAILLHSCAHNPTGLDPSEAQWRELAQLCLRKKLFVVFDSAYQGFASGDLDHDAWAVRYFMTFPELELAVCQSFSKNLGLYGERVGALHIVPSRTLSLDAAAESAKRVQGHVVDIHRALVSMAPLFGSQVATIVLTSNDLRALWRTDLATMSGRIKAMRQALYDELQRLETPGSWNHIVEQTGMFSYTGLTEQQVAILRTEHHVYMLPTGRASVCGLTRGNVKYAAQAIDRVVRDTSA
ncbi:aminotransferase class I and II domain-containing protein [Sarocladium implicatum]|nr:aminotransferase class I and II domain-containing protein [Sarocladium implicatum]